MRMGAMPVLAKRSVALAVALLLALSTAAVLVGCGEDAADEIDEVRDDVDSNGDQGDVDASLAPSFTLETLTGEPVTLEEYRGKVVLVNFWATWCLPCVEEIPLFELLRAEVGPADFEILAISVDEEPQLVVPEFLDSIGGVSYPVLVGTRDVVDAYDIGIGIPATYIVNREGRVVETLIGGQALNVFEPLIRKHL